MRSDFKEKYGPWAMVLGASEGIGEAFARRLAAAGFNIILNARNPEKLERKVNELKTAFGVEVEHFAYDLSLPDLPDRLIEWRIKKDIGLLVYNAAYGPVRRFGQNSLEQLDQHVSVNCRGPLLSAGIFRESMAKRGKGGMIILSSIAGFQGANLIAPYAASKAFDTALGEGLYHELKEEGIDVLACAAGATKTPNYLGTEPDYGLFKPTEQDPDEVARIALEKLGKQAMVISGASNRFSVFLFSRLLGRNIASRFMSKTLKKVYQRQWEATES